jgi:hypothetical protein
MELERDERPQTNMPFPTEASGGQSEWAAVKDQPRPEPIFPSQTAERPSWLREGIVGSWYMCPVGFYIRRGFVSYYDVEPVDPAFLWRAAFDEATVKHYKDIGINLLILPLHLGAGLKTEAESIEATRKLTQNAHRYGIRVAGYVGSSMMVETFYSEEPEAHTWEQIDERGRPMYYFDQTFRHAACRNNPGYRAFLQKVLRLGIVDLKLDMIHFDQLAWWAEPCSCHCQHCQEGFRAFLRKRYTDEQLKLRLGHANLEGIRVPEFNIGGSYVMEGGSVPMPLKDPLLQEWVNFRCTSLAEWWAETHAYIRQLNPEVVLLGNAGYDPQTNVGFTRGVDAQQLFPHCELLWSEDENAPNWTSDGRLVSRIRTHKIARGLGGALAFWQEGMNQQGVYQAPFDELSSVLGVAESLAYNDANLGMWYGGEGGEEPPPRAQQYIRFFNSHLKDLVDTKPVTDVAILRSFASIQFNPAKSNVSTMLFEQTLIQHKVPFGIIFDSHLHDLSRYKVLVLANQDALSDEQVGQVRRFVEGGGGLVATEDTSLLTEWRRRRRKLALADVLGLELPPAAGQAEKSLRREFGKGRVVYIATIEPAVEPPPAEMSYSFTNKCWKLPKNDAELVEALRWAAREEFSVKVEAPLWVTMELAEQQSTGTWLLHLLNFKTAEPVRDIGVELRIPEGMRLREAVLESPDGVPRQVLDLSAREGTVRFTVPKLHVYDLVVLRSER